MKITMEDIRRGGGCALGLKAFFTLYNLDLKAFLKKGYIDSEEALKTGDALAIYIVNLAKEKESDGR